MLNTISAILANGVSAVGDYESIQTYTMTTNQAVVEFTSIPQTFSHLQLRILSRDSSAGSDVTINFQFNGDTTANYAHHYLAGFSSTASAAAFANQNNGYIQRFPSSTSAANVFGAAVVDILDYKSTTKNKTVRNIGGFENNTVGRIDLDSNLWFKTPEAITSIKLMASSNFVQYSQFALYGVK